MARRNLIGVFMYRWGWGGVEQFFSELIQEKPLQAYDFHLSFFERDPTSPVFQAGLRVKPIPVNRLERAFHRYPYRLWMTCGSHCQAALLSHRYKVPHFWKVMGSFRETHPEFSSRQAQMTAELIASLSSRIITVSQFVRSELPMVPKIPVRVIYNGLNPDRFQDPDGNLRKSFRKEFGLGPEDIAIGMIANFAPHKRQHLLLQSLSHLPKRERIKCFLIGDTRQIPDYTRRLVSQKENSPRRKDILFTGIRTDISRVLAGLDIVVLPSPREGLSIAILEAMASGKAVIVTRQGSFPEFVVDGETGVLIPAEDPQALARAIEKLAHQPALREFLGTNARSSVRDRFHIRDAARRYAEVFDSVGRG